LGWIHGASTHHQRARDHEVAGDVRREDIAQHEESGQIDHARDDAEHRWQSVLHLEQGGLFVGRRDRIARRL
jgi:hypothetical protein